MNAFESHLPEQITRSLAMQGAAWAAIGALGRYLIAGATTLILIRILEPSDFGLFAIAFAAHEFVAHITTVGFYDALIQVPEIDTPAVAAGFWSALFASVCASLVVVAVAAPVATWFDQPRLVFLLVGAAAAGMLRAGSTVPRALFARRLDFRTPALVRLGGMVVASVTALGVALAGGGAWSLLVRFGVLNLVVLVVLWRRSGVKVARLMDRAALRYFWSFALSVSLSTVLAFVITHADDQLIGYRLGSEMLGYYVIAYGLMSWLVHDVLGGVAVVAYPIFARLQTDRARLRAAYLSGVQLTALLCFPVLCLILVTAPQLVSWLLGSEWDAVVLPAQIFVLGGLRECTGMLNGSIYRAVGRPDLHFVLELAGGACFVVAFWVGLDFGIAGVAFFYVLTGFLWQPAIWWLVLSVLGVSWSEWWRSLAPAAISAMAMVFVCAAELTWLVGVVGVPVIGVLGFVGVSGLLVYGIVLYVGARLSLWSVIGF